MESILPRDRRSGSTRSVSAPPEIDRGSGPRRRQRWLTGLHRTASRGAGETGSCSGREVGATRRGARPCRGVDDGVRAGRPARRDDAHDPQLRGAGERGRHRSWSPARRDTASTGRRGRPGAPLRAATRHRAVRAARVIRSLIDATDGLDVHETAAANHVSDSTFEADLARVRARLEGTGLTLVRHGSRITLVGPETARRRLLGALFREESSRGMLELDTLRAAFPQVADFRVALIAGLAEAGYAPNEYGLNDVLLHTAIALDRVATNHPLDEADAPAPAPGGRARGRWRADAAARSPSSSPGSWPSTSARQSARPTSRTSPGSSRRARRPARRRRRTRMPQDGRSRPGSRSCAGSSRARHPRTSSTSTTRTSSTGWHSTSTASWRVRATRTSRATRSRPRSRPRIR